MFKKFDQKDSISGTSLLKSSAQRAIRKDLLDQYPALEEIMDHVLPKKNNLIITKCHERINLLSVDGEPLFFQHFDGPYFPTLRLLHKYPALLQTVQVDAGAIKFILQGADIMSPGLTSSGGRFGADLLAGAMVAIMAEGKETALSVGIMKMSAKQIRDTNQGHAIENVHYLNDGLWKLKSLSSS